MSDRPEPARILLVGMMGAGKTTVGRLLAEQLGWPYCDSDAQVEAATGCTAPELFERDGEAGFRRAETAALIEALTQGESVVVSVAGGAVLDPTNRELLRHSGRVVWLRATPKTLARRVGNGSGRPLLGDDPAAALRRLDAERRSLYEEIAEQVIDVDGLDPSDVVGQILATTVPSP